MGSKSLANDENPFENLKISENWTNLHQVGERTICPQCNKSRKYFCYTCYLPVSEIKDYVPQIKLPLKVDIIKHAREIDGKSTAVHAAVLCPGEVTVYTYPSIPSYLDTLEKTILVFPSPNAVSIEELIQSLAVDYEHEEHKTTAYVSRVVFIDSTWNQSRGIYKDPRLFKLPCVILKKRITQFWRHQNGVPRWHLSTIEAIHQFFVEYDIVIQNLGSKLFLKENFKDFSDQNGSNSQTDGTTSVLHSEKFDNLLFFFRFMYDKIHTLYDHSSLKSYKRPLE